MRKTLLEMVQSILSEMDSDAVNSISDTAESEQVAQILQDCYAEMLSNRNWPHTRKLFQLDASTTLARPNYLKIPVLLKEMEFFKYEVQGASSNIVAKEVKHMYPDEFLSYIAGRNSSNSNVQTVQDTSGVRLLILNDVAPTYYTSFDDVWLVTDSYDSAVDDTLQKQKTQCLGYTYPVWTTEDNFVPDLPTEAFPALINEAKSTAFLALKQMNNVKAEQKAKRQQAWLSRKAWSVEGDVRFEDYGRKGRR